MNYRVMVESDIEAVIPLYIEYYNNVDGSSWTYETTYKRIHQVITREDSFCMILEEGSSVIGFAIGYCEQFDDIIAYNLVEIVVALQYQNKGIGTAFMQELETRIKEQGVSLIQLQAENDEMHKHFYGQKLNFLEANSFITMTKWLKE